MLDPIRERGSKINEADIRDIAIAGTQAARQVSLPVVEAVREKMHLRYPL